MTTLEELQSSFQRAILEGDDAVLAKITDSPKEKRDVLLGVYRNAYVSRLTDILAADYEQLHACLGDEQFGQMASAYIAANPSQTPNARWYGAKLPEFLSQWEPYAQTPLLADLATLEKNLNDVFDEQDIQSLTRDELAQVAPEAWPALIFTPHPATRRADLKTNAIDVWQALKDGEAPPEAIDLADSAQLIAYRPDHSAMFRTMPHEEAMMWDAAARGLPFSELCALVAFAGGEDGAAIRAAGYLQGWVATGMLAESPLPG